jgi:hypothetical protein
MNKRRLLKLADLLDADAKNKRGISFNMMTVIERDDDLTHKGKPVPMDCGTQACAMGLAALSGAFTRSGGLSYTLRETGYGGFSIETTINGHIRNYDRAAMSVFDLSMKQADFLFTPDSYDLGISLRNAEGERYVAQRIRDFVAGKVGP